jgi:hypothetical protein
MNCGEEWGIRKFEQIPNTFFFQAIKIIFEVLFQLAPYSGCDFPAQREPISIVAALTHRQISFFVFIFIKSCISAQIGEANYESPSYFPSLSV